MIVEDTGNSNFEAVFESAAIEKTDREELEMARRLLAMVDQMLEERNPELQSSPVYEHAIATPVVERLRITAMGDIDRSSENTYTENKHDGKVYTINDFEPEDPYEMIFGSSPEYEEPEPIFKFGRRLSDGKLVATSDFGDRLNSVVADIERIIKGMQFESVLFLFLTIFLFALYLGTRTGFRSGYRKAKNEQQQIVLIQQPSI